jgi:hypothetical protein
MMFPLFQLLCLLVDCQQASSRPQCEELRQILQKPHVMVSGDDSDDDDDDDDDDDEAFALRVAVGLL